MSKEERANIVALVTGILLNTFVVIRLVQLFGSGALSGEDATMIWARAIVWVIPAAIVLTIIFNVLLAFAFRDREDKNVVDERDRKFQIRGLSVLLVSLGLGYIAMIVVFAIGWPAVAGLTLLYASCAAGDLIGNTVRFASYRLGA